MSYKIGIDVGGTNTDAVLLENDLVIASTKHFTTKDIKTGIEKAIKQLLDNTTVSKDKIKHAMLGTTQCTNAIVQAKELNKVVLIRIGMPAADAILPYCDWPEKLVTKVNHSYHLIEGGYQYDGKPIAKFNEQNIIDIVNECKDDVKNFAVSCIFSQIQNDQELKTREIIKNIIPDANVSISSEIGNISLLERENATILNAALNSVSKQVVTSYQKALETNGIYCDKIYLCQNDGTVMTSEHALNFPILTIASGPTNSIAGASLLAKKENAIVIDVGGTTSDLGVINNGLARESKSDSTIGGVRTNFRMPDVVSIGIGGGSIINVDNDQITIGPESVGYKLATESLVFGGNTLTLTDVAVALNYFKLGDVENVKHIDKKFAEKVMEKVATEIEIAIDAIKLHNQDSEVIFVGGGSVCLPDNINGVSNIIRPKHFSVTNAVGAASAKVSGTFEGIFNLIDISRDDAINQATKLAIKSAINSGAIVDSVEIKDVQDNPIAYHPKHASKIAVKCLGNLKI